MLRVSFVQAVAKAWDPIPAKTVMGHTYCWPCVSKPAKNDKDTRNLQAKDNHQTGEKPSARLQPQINPHDRNIFQTISIQIWQVKP